MPIEIFYPALCCCGIAALVLVVATIKIIQQNHVGIVERLGKYSRTIGAGVNFLIPLIESVPSIIDLAVQNLLFNIDTVSKDKVVVRLKANLIYTIDPEKASDFHYNLSNPWETVQSFVENYTRSFVATQTHEELLEKREEISEYLIRHLDAKMRNWGIKIVSFQLMDIVFPTEITDAMSKVVASQRLREAALNEAEGAKVKVVKQAEAEKQSRVLLGEGVAGERQAIIDGLKKSINDMQTIKGISTEEVMNLVALSQYFDTIKSIGDSENTKVMFINPSPKGVNDLVQQLTSAIEGTKPVGEK